MVYSSCNHQFACNNSRSKHFSNHTVGSQEQKSSIKIYPLSPVYVEVEPNLCWPSSDVTPKQHHLLAGQSQKSYSEFTLYHVSMLATQIHFGYLKIYKSINCTLDCNSGKFKNKVHMLTAFLSHVYRMVLQIITYKARAS